jgi:hypothetical protein
MMAIAMAIGVAVLIATEFFTQSVTGPKGKASVADTAVESTGASTAAGTRVDAQLPQGWKIEPLPPETPGNASSLSKVRTFDASEVHGTKANNATPSAAVATLHVPVSLPNGTDLIPAPDSEGLGTLKISNYTDHDAVVKLKTSVDRTTVRFFYVRARSDVTVAKILPGEYVLQFATGRDWDATDLLFRQDQAFAAFDTILPFSEREVEDGTVYSTHEVTLHAVPNGNIRRKTISAEKFSDDVGVGRDRR